MEQTRDLVCRQSSAEQLSVWQLYLKDDQYKRPTAEGSPDSLFGRFGQMALVMTVNRYKLLAYKFVLGLANDVDVLDAMLHFYTRQMRLDSAQGSTKNTASTLKSVLARYTGYVDFLNFVFFGPERLNMCISGKGDDHVYVYNRNEVCLTRGFVYFEYSKAGDRLDLVATDCV